MNLLIKSITCLKYYLASYLHSLMYMRKFNTLLVFCVSLIYTLQLNSQVVFKAPTLMVDPNSQLTVQIETDNFTDIVSIQFAIQWDPAVLEFDSIQHDFVLEGMFGEDENVDEGDDGIEDQFGAFPDEGKLRFSWFQPSTAGQTLANGTSLFTIAFNVIGANGTSTDLTLGPCPGFVVEIVDNTGNEVQANFDQGSVMVGSNNLIFLDNNPDFTLYQNAPNPFIEGTKIFFELKNSSKTQFKLYNLNGKLIFAKDEFSQAGENVLYLNRAIFPAAGTYYYSLNTTDYIATKKLVVLN